MELDIISLAKGTVGKLSEFPDDIIAEKTMGDGYLLYLSDNTIYAPFDGVVSVLYPSNHAMIITSSDGVSIMIHIGAETYKIMDLNKSYLKVNDTFKKGDKLIKTDYKKLKKLTGSSVVAFVYLNQQQVTSLKDGYNCDKLEVIGKLEANND